MKITADIKKESNSLLWWLTLILIIRITSYFMLSESVVVTQLFKIGMRFFVTGVSFIILRNLFTRNRNLSFGYQYPMAIIFYLCYLGLGILSLLWTSGMADSLLQLMMDIENLVFLHYFHKHYFRA